MLYRDKIILAYRALLETHEELMDRIINVGMTGEFAEVNIFNKTNCGKNSN